MNMKSRGFVGAIALSALILGPLAPLAGDFVAGPALAKSDGNGGGKGGGNAGGKGKEKSAARSGGQPVEKVRKKSATAASVSASAGVATPAPNAHGMIASELKGLNAYHASPTAFANASPNSQVGRIATYRDAALATIAAGEALDTATTALETANADLTAAEAALADFDAAHTGRSTAEIDSDIAALDPAAPDYQQQLDALNTERTAAESYATDRAILDSDVAAAAGIVSEAEAAVASAAGLAAESEALEGDALLSASNGRTLSEPALDYLRTQLGL